MEASYRMDGITPILSMPFDSDEEMIFDELRSQVDFLVDSEVRAVGFGFGSEITRLTEGEMWDALRVVTEHARDRVEVMATVGGGSIRALVKQGVLAANAGANVVMMRPPQGCNVEEMIASCAELWDAVGLPIVFQDAPEFTMVEADVDQLSELVERVPGVRALKIECPDPLPKIARLSEMLGDQVSVLGGAGGFDFLAELDVGANGTVPFVAFAPHFVQTQRLHEAHRRDEAVGVFEQMRPIFELAITDPGTVFFTFKELLWHLGVLKHEVAVRRPGRPPSAEFRAQLKRLATAIERPTATVEVQ